MSDKFEGEPKPAELELSTEWEGTEGLVKVHVQPFMDGLQIDIETIHGRTTINDKDALKLAETVRNYQVALHAVRGTQP